MRQDVTPKSAGERRRNRRLEEIAEVARGLFAARGFTETSLAEIADAVDLSPKAIYYYYPSKRAILDAILGRGFQYFEAAELAAARTQWDGLGLREALFESGIAAVEEIVGHADLLRLSFSETFRGDALTRTRHEKYMRNWVEHVEILLGDPARGDSVAPERRRPLADAVVDGLFGMAVDSVLRGREGVSATSDGASEVQRRVTGLIESLLDGSQSD